MVINTGSSSIKFQLFDMANNSAAIVEGLIERIGEAKGRIKYKRAKQGDEYNKEEVFNDHKDGLELVAKLLVDKQWGVIDDVQEIDAVGHRTVHGGERFNKSVHIDDKVMNALKEMIPLAPLHNPANITGIEVAQQIFPHANQVAIFDTAFHQTMPPKAYRYAIPEKLYRDSNIRRYGFHGTSHLYVSREASSYLNIPIEKFNCITIHIGNGCSMAAIAEGKSVDTSMGMTPLEGLIMGTRCGDIDPAIPYYLATNNSMTIEDINTTLNKESGVKGIADSNDLRDIEERYIAGNDEKAKLAIEMYAYRIKKYIGAYFAALSRVDAIIFTAGVGENSDIIRELACDKLDNLGICLDVQKNKGRKKGICDLSKDNTKVKILVVSTNEELEIARQTRDVVQGTVG